MFDNIKYKETIELKDTETVINNPDDNTVSVFSWRTGKLYTYEGSNFIYYKLLSAEPFVKLHFY